jgi:tetratricopeptide (TPR) repeat protein
MTSGRRKLLWACGCAAGLALAATALILVRLGNAPPLPALRHYSSLPQQFDRALQVAWARAAASSRAPNDVRHLAHLYQANRLNTEAKACYLVIAKGPGGLSASDHYYLADVALEESDLGTAATELAATLQGEPGYVPARLKLADVLFKSGQPEEAAKEYEAIIATDAHHPQALYGMARIEQQRGNDDAAVARLRDLVGHHPESTSGAALLANILDRRGETEEAASMRERSQHTQEPIPADPWMKALLVDCYDLLRLGTAFEDYQRTGQMGEALPFLDRLEELDPKGWTAPMLRGWSQKQAGHYPEAVAEYRLALNNGGDPERICPLLVNALLNGGRPADAAALLAQYRARLPQSIPILLSYSEVAVRMRDSRLARSLLAEVLQKEPYLYMPNMSMAQILWVAGEHDAAAQCLQRVAKVYPADVDSRGLLGQYYMEKADPWSAIAPLEQAIADVGAKDPRRERLTKMLDTAYLSAGSLEASRGHYEKAASFSEKSILLVPNGMRGYGLKANVCRKMKDFKGAEQALEKMSSLDPAEPMIELSIGDVVYQAGDRDKAREHWQRALQLAPSNATELRAAVGLRLGGHVPADL